MQQVCASMRNKSWHSCVGHASGSSTLIRGSASLLSIVVPFGLLSRGVLLLLASHPAICHPHSQPLSSPCSRRKRLQAGGVCT